MGHSNLKKELNTLLVPKERVISKGQGCWNCKHWDREMAKPLWTQKRQGDLTTALNLALDLPKGEPTTMQEAVEAGPNGVRCFNIKSMVDSLDHLVASGHVGVCKGGGRNEKDDPVGDFVVHSFQCDRWTGVSGASLATGGKSDTLPMELAEKIDKPKPS
jgi:hypothetical protein